MSFSDELRYFGSADFSSSSQTFSAGFDALTVVHGKDGRDGKDGKDGATPRKGVDYWTEADKAELIGLVLQAVGLPRVTAEDNGKILQVVEGVWSAVPFVGGSDPNPDPNLPPEGGGEEAAPMVLGQGLLGSLILGGV